jgi:hypothetical protein
VASRPSQTSLLPIATLFGLGGSQREALPGPFQRETLPDPRRGPKPFRKNRHPFTESDTHREKVGGQRKEAESKFKTIFWITRPGPDLAAEDSVRSRIYLSSKASVDAYC